MSSFCCPLIELGDKQWQISEHAQSALVVAEDDELLPHQLDRLQRPRPGQFFGQRDRLPIAAQASRAPKGGWVAWR
jgi:hypothetical protein